MRLKISVLYVLPINDLSISITLLLESISLHVVTPTNRQFSDIISEYISYIYILGTNLLNRMPIKHEKHKVIGRQPVRVLRNVQPPAFMDTTITDALPNSTLLA